MKLDGKQVLLTGGSAGIGKELALQLRDKGAQVVLTGRNPERLAQMRELGFEAIAANLSNAKGVDALIAEWGARELDILINNAGQLVDHDYRKIAPDPDAADDCIYSNLNAPIRLTGGLIELLKSRPQASIVNVTSGLAIAPAARQPVYCATKAGLRFYTLTLREQLRGTKVKVIEALPPAVATQMNPDPSPVLMSAPRCASQIVKAIEQDASEVNIGLTKVLRVVDSMSPATARLLTLRA